MPDDPQITMTEIEYLRLWKRSVELAEQDDPECPRVYHLGGLVEDWFLPQHFDHLEDDSIHVR